jgi:adenosylcobinamide-phosphate guanylyltransferase
MPHLSAVVVAGEPGESGGIGQEKAMISALGRPLIDYVLEALRGCREVSEVIVSVTGSTPLTEVHVRSRGYQSITCPGADSESDLRYVLQRLPTPYALTVPANLPLLRPESIDDVVEEFYRSKKSSLVVGFPIDDVQEMIADPAIVKNMDGIRAIPCGLRVLDRAQALDRSGTGEGYLVTDLEDFAVDVNTISQLSLAEAILRGRRKTKRSTSGIW